MRPLLDEVVNGIGQALGVPARSQRSVSGRQTWERRFYARHGKHTELHQNPSTPSALRLKLIESMYKLYKSSSSRSETADDARDFWLKVTGWRSDHAEDHKKLFRLVAAMTIPLERERREEQHLPRSA
ncbi:hypothetical protein B0H13DRAFT_2349215 [Mycena leptocephala]|nr:hypothetical protein B0H13DRAFT_2349215 [Mycena leptocephala]